MLLDHRNGGKSHRDGFVGDMGVITTSENSTPAEFLCKMIFGAKCSSTSAFLPLASHHPSPAGVTIPIVTLL